MAQIHTLKTYLKCEWDILSLRIRVHQEICLDKRLITVRVLILQLSLQLTPSLGAGRSVRLFEREH